MFNPELSIEARKADFAAQFRFPASDGLIVVLGGAVAEAGKFNHHFIGTEHLLLGLFQNPQATDLLGFIGLERHKARSAIEFINGSSIQPQNKDIQGLTSRSESVFRLAVSLADELEAPELEPLHLLLGILREDGGVAVGVLDSLGISLPMAKMVVEREIKFQSEGQLEKKRLNLLNELGQTLEDPAKPPELKEYLKRELRRLADLKEPPQPQAID